MAGSKSDIQVGSVVDIAFGATGIADPANPTAAEINQLTRIECDIAGDANVSTPRSGNTVDISALCELETYEVPTTIVNGRIVIPFHRYLGAGVDDVAWDLFDDSINPRPETHLVIARGGFSGAGTPAVAAAGDIVDVYTTKVIVRMEQDIGKETKQQGTVELSVINREPGVTVVA